MQSILIVFTKIKDDSSSIWKVKNILADQQLDLNLVCIKANFGTITQLEKHGLKLLVDSINIVPKIIDKMKAIIQNQRL